MIKIKYCVNEASVLRCQHTLFLVSLRFWNKNSQQDSKLVRTVLDCIDICKCSRDLYGVRSQSLLFCEN